MVSDGQRAAKPTRPCAARDCRKSHGTLLDSRLSWTEGRSGHVAKLRKDSEDT